ncbi:imidazole glycerol phosphate synthase subunit HisF (fragment) [Nitrospina watsonii]|uniref:Imidazole glycerol phosphate synthase subunit HisF n=1 Tax=Nitrospina watsonii TaxID=1323948 RepID=A0ABM9HA52_9BACT
MTSVVRVIPRLDIKGPNLIKGIQFDGHRVLGTAEEFAEIYDREGADELIYQDAVASLYMRNSLHDIVKKTAQKIFIPLTVAGKWRLSN